MGFEKRPVDYQDFESELSGPGLGELKLPAVMGVAVVAVLGVLLFGGVSMPTPLMDMMQGPYVADAPGHADEANGLDLAAVESQVLDEVNRQRSTDGLSALSMGSTLDDLATFENQRRVTTAYDGGTVHGSRDEFSPGCGGPVRLLVSDDPAEASLAPNVDDFESEDDLATYIARMVVDEPTMRDALDRSQSGYGVDVHVAPDGSIWVVHTVC
ncbi:hypothetical protein [Haloarchaeobius sp. DFWS5]|uniref:hypothetical protein n=1 Tax=Haloarchaeobius sp. DFWS5 TaxID=3446114 RepID=UPI003EBD5232